MIAIDWNTMMSPPGGKTSNAMRNRERSPGLNPLSHEAFKRRLERLIEERTTVVGLAREAGLANTAIHAWLAGSEPSRAKLAQLAEALGVSLDWLIAGRGPKCGLVLVPHHPADMREGKIPDAEFAFNSEWIATLPGGPAQPLLLVTMDGDSMEPTFRHGDVVLVNVADREPRDGLFAIWVGQPPSEHLRLALRRIHTNAFGGYRVLCDNANYPPDEIIASADVLILGRAVWRSGKL